MATGRAWDAAFRPSLAMPRPPRASLRDATPIAALAAPADTRASSTAGHDAPATCGLRRTAAEGGLRPGPAAAADAITGTRPGAAGRSGIGQAGHQITRVIGAGQLELQKGCLVGMAPDTGALSPDHATGADSAAQTADMPDRRCV